jgi:hypothetical protein
MKLMIRLGDGHLMADIVQIQGTRFSNKDHSVVLTGCQIANMEIVAR